MTSGLAVLLCVLSLLACVFYSAMRLSAALPWSFVLRYACSLWFAVVASVAIMLLAKGLLFVGTDFHQLGWPEAGKAALTLLLLWALKRAVAFLSRSSAAGKAAAEARARRRY